ncbi:MAG TPA: DUF1566 domain-containing protein [Polyangiales bacterium]
MTARVKILAGPIGRVFWLALALSACSSAAPGASDSEVGALVVALTLPADAGISSVDYRITPSARGRQTVGAISVAGPGPTMSATIDGLPVAEGSVLTLTATGSDGSACVGSMKVDIGAGETRAVSVSLSCGVDQCAGPNVCTSDYPCENLPPSYRCRGQFADWSPSYSGPSDFTANGDGTVADLRSGLVWQKTVGPDVYQAACTTKYTLAAATAYCGSLGLAGATWRLPSKAELESLVDDTYYDPTMLDPKAFPNTPSLPFWTSSPCAGASNSGKAWAVEFYEGFSTPAPVSNELCARCVH